MGNDRWSDCKTDERLKEGRIDKLMIMRLIR